MLAQLEEQLEREKHFTSDVSHELRTPTAVIMAESEYGKDYTETVAEAKEEFQHIFQQSRRMSRLINQLLELSRLDSRKDLVLGPVKLSQLETRVREMAMHLALEEKKQEEAGQREQDARRLEAAGQENPGARNAGEGRAECESGEPGNAGCGSTESDNW